MIDPTPLPGLSERTVVVTAAASELGHATCLLLLCSGATVIAVDTHTELPSALEDAGTGLDGVLHYREADGADHWSGLADWIGEHHAGVDGLVLAGETHHQPVLPHLSDAASVVVVTGSPAIPEGIRTNVVDPHPESRPEDTAAAIVFLLSEPAQALTGSVIRVAAAPSPAV